MCEQCDKLRAELSELRQAVGLATTAVPDMVMDADHPIEMIHKVVAENRRLQERVRELAEIALNWIVSAQQARGSIFGPRDEVDYESAKQRVFALQHKKEQ